MSFRKPFVFRQLLLVDVTRYSAKSGSDIWGGVMKMVRYSAKSGSSLCSLQKKCGSFISITVLKNVAQPSVSVDYGTGFRCCQRSERFCPLAGQEETSQPLPSYPSRLVPKNVAQYSALLHFQPVFRWPGRFLVPQAVDKGWSQRFSCVFGWE